MKKVTMKKAKEIMKKDYIDALQYFSEYLMQFDEDEDEMEYQLYKLDERIFERSIKWDLSDTWLKIYTALKIGL